MLLRTILLETVSERRQLEDALTSANLTGSARRIVKKKMGYLTKISAQTVAALVGEGFTTAEVSKIVDEGVRLNARKSEMTSSVRL